MYMKVGDFHATKAPTTVPQRKFCKQPMVLQRFNEINLIVQKILNSIIQLVQFCVRRLLENKAAAARRANLEGPFISYVVQYFALI